MKILTSLSSVIIAVIIISSCASCKSNKKVNTESLDSLAVQINGPKFNPDSAFEYCRQQCKFGPRVMNSDTHEKCGVWIATMFHRFGCKVTEQKTTIKGWDGKELKCTNIIASYKPEATERILICAHWDSRPWADNDPDSANHHKPVMAANDGASGVGVMLEVARQLQQDKKLNIGVDFVCFDAEDYGTPYWTQDDPNSWALGAQYWAEQARGNYKARFGILLDMVGGQGATFYQESMSKKYAQHIVDKVWHAARIAGFGSMFKQDEGGAITDDHIPVNQKAGIPTIDIIPYYPDCQQSAFGPTWHTVSDDMLNLDKNTLEAVGQTVIQTLYSEK